MFPMRRQFGTEPKNQFRHELKIQLGAKPMPN
jgi:hypothetical protein